MTDIVQPEWMKGHVPMPNPGNPNWKKGAPSPNPAGRPKGVLDKKQKVEAALRDEGPAVARVVLDAALAGDMTAAGIVLARIAPTLRAQAEKVEFAFDPSLPIGRQVEAVLAAVAGGQVAPDIGQVIVSMVGTLSQVRATEELEQRLAILEAKAVN
jgi:hypothetical protein